MKNLFLSIIVLFCACNIAEAQINKPERHKSFKPGAVWSDDSGNSIRAHNAGIIWAKGKYYWHGVHYGDLPIGKIYPPEAGNLTMVGVTCYSSNDLYNWKYEGVALSVSNDSTNDMYKGLRIERPKVIYNESTKQYVMWFHYVQSGKTHGESYEAGVAVASKVTGPFKFIKKIRPDDGQMCRDCSLFKDEDGKAYFIYASEENKTLHISLLTPDYLDCSGKWKRVLVDQVREAPAIFKRNGVYHMITSACWGWSPNPALHSYSTEMLGEWKNTGNLCLGKDSKTTFNSQSTFVLQVHGKKDAYVFLADRWNTQKMSDSRHIWLPVLWQNDNPVLEWKDEWDLSVFDKKRN